MEALDAELAAAQEELARRQQRQARAAEEAGEAQERQRKRRQIDEVNAQISDVNEHIEYVEGYTAAIDADEDGSCAPGSEVAPRRERKTDAQPELSVRFEACCQTAVVKNEMEWKIQGMSWLQSSLKQNFSVATYSDECQLGGKSFRLEYSPSHRNWHYRMKGDQTTCYKSSLAVRHLDDEPLTFRHSFFIKRNDGEFIQWGETREECIVQQDAEHWNFGPDIQQVAPENDRTPAAGIFGLSYKELLRSHWVTDDTMTVLVKLEVRKEAPVKRTTVAAPPAIEVPPSTLVSDMLAQLEDADESGDVTFVVDSVRLRAHSFPLCARSEVFAHMLRGSMREAASREVEVDECDAVTFRALLRYLYSDDLERMDEWIQKAATESVGDGGGAAEAFGSSSASGPPDAAATRIALLQRVLAVSHRYQVSRLRLWSERKLSELVSVATVCDCLCQAHLYEARQLEEECLDFIRVHRAKVSVTPAFGALSTEWPAVMLKVVHKMADVPAEEAMPALEAAKAQGTKRKRAAA